MNPHQDLTQPHQPTTPPATLPPWRWYHGLSFAVGLAAMAFTLLCAWVVFG